MAEASKFYCQKCLKVTLYIGQKPKYCSTCGLNFLNGLPASHVKGDDSTAIFSDSLEIVSSAGDINSAIEIDNSSAQFLNIGSEPDVIEKPVKPKKRGRPKKEKEQNDLSWFSKSAGTLRPNFRKN